MIELPKYSNQELLESLQEYQKEIIQELLVNNNEDEAIELWINANGPINNVNFGGTQEKNQLLKNFKIELCKLLSESPEYEEQVKEIKVYINIGKDAIISGLTLALAPKLGATAIIVVPLVVLAMMSISKVGVKAYCNTILNREENK